MKRPSNKCPFNKYPSNRQSSLTQNLPTQGALTSEDTQHAIGQTQAWLKNVVIGLGLCPFASRPVNDGTVHFEVIGGRGGNGESRENEEYSEQALLDRVLEHCDALQALPPSQRETTLLILPTMLASFDDFCVFIDWANSALALHNYEGVFQIASFHPQYCFDGVQPNDKTNLTNRAPYPIVHLLREQSIEYALDAYGDVDALIEKNMDKMSELDTQQLHRLFPYLF